MNVILYFTTKLIKELSQECQLLPSKVLIYTLSFSIFRLSVIEYGLKRGCGKMEYNCDVFLMT
jgi:hypothetical protein